MASRRPVTPQVLRSRRGPPRTWWRLAAALFRQRPFLSISGTARLAFVAIVGLAVEQRWSGRGSVPPESIAEDLLASLTRVARPDLAAALAELRGAGVLRDDGQGGTTFGGGIANRLVNAPRAVADSAPRGDLPSPPDAMARRRSGGRWLRWPADFLRRADVVVAGPTAAKVFLGLATRLAHRGYGTGEAIPSAELNPVVLSQETGMSEFDCGEGLDALRSAGIVRRRPSDDEGECIDPALWRGMAFQARKRDQVRRSRAAARRGSGTDDRDSEHRGADAGHVEPSIPSDTIHFGDSKPRIPPATSGNGSARVFGPEPHGDDPRDADESSSSGAASDDDDVMALAREVLGSETARNHALHLRRVVAVNGLASVQLALRDAAGANNPWLAFRAKFGDRSQRLIPARIGRRAPSNPPFLGPNGSRRSAARGSRDPPSLALCTLREGGPTTLDEEPDP